MTYTTFTISYGKGKAGSALAYNMGDHRVGGVSIISVGNVKTVLDAVQIKLKLRAARG